MPCSRLGPPHQEQSLWAELNTQLLHCQLRKGRNARKSLLLKNHILFTQLVWRTVAEYSFRLMDNRYRKFLLEKKIFLGYFDASFISFIKILVRSFTEQITCEQGYREVGTGVQ